MGVGPNVLLGLRRVSDICAGVPSAEDELPVTLVRGAPLSVLLFPGEFVPPVPVLYVLLWLRPSAGFRRWRVRVPFSFPAALFPGGNPPSRSLPVPVVLLLCSAA